MTEEQIRMLDTENAAKDRYEYDKRLLAELNAGNIEWVKTIIKGDMKIYEDDYLYVENDEEGKIIELANIPQNS